MAMGRRYMVPAQGSNVELEREPEPRTGLARETSAAAACVAVTASLFLLCVAVPGLSGASRSVPAALLDEPAPRLLSGDQHIWIIRHGDKYSSYPDCPAEPPCFDKGLMGDNPPLTDCGRKQASFTAAWLKNASSLVGGIKHIVVSPYTRTLQTSLPLAQALGLKLQVEYLLSEANQPEGPHREFNIKEDKVTVADLLKASELWDTLYGSPPIPTPEVPELYGKRVKRAAEVLTARFPPSAGNAAIYTHATTSFSIAYGLCHSKDGTDATLEDFVKKQAAIAPAGVIHLVRDNSGKCKVIDQTANVAKTVGCGKTEPYKCEFDDYPAWYWPHADGKGPGKCH